MAAWPTVLRWVLPRGDFSRNVTTLTLGTAAGHLITLAAAPLLTRLFGPEDFGVFALYTSTLVIAMTVAAGRYHVALPLEEDDRTAFHLLLVAVILACGSTAILTIAVAWKGDSLTTVFGLQPLRPYLWLIPAGLFAAMLHDILTYWAIRNRSFTRIFTSKIVQSGGTAATQVSSGFAAFGTIGLIGGDVIGRVAGVAVFAARSFVGHRMRIKEGVSHVDMWRVAIRYREFPLVYAGSNLINTANFQIVPVMIALLFGSATTGFFGLAARFIFLPMSFVGQSVAQVFYGTASRLYREDRRQLKAFVYSIAGKLSIVSIGFAVVLIAAGPDLFALLFGHEWRESGEFARILAAPQLLQFVYSPISHLFNIFQKQRVHLLWSLILLVSSVAALVAGYLVGSVYHALAFFAATNTFTYAAALIVFRRWLNDITD